VAKDDWRIRIELAEEDHAHGLLAALSRELPREARDLARELADARLAATRDGTIVYVYSGTREQARQAVEVVEAQLAHDGLDARTKIEHWLPEAERWDDEPPQPTIEEEEVAHGHAPWEVRVECESHHAAAELADRLEQEGFGVVRGWRYVIAGTASREEAESLAQRLNGEVEPGGALAWEVTPQNPFAVFGGLGV
jgi:hypothetical protein